MKKTLSKKSMLVMIGCIVLGVILISFPFGKKTEGEQSEYKEVEVESYTERLEEKIRSLCCSVKGAGEVTVLLTLESGNEMVYASNKTGQKEADGSATNTSDYLIIDKGDGSEPLLVKEIYPRVRGVAVVCHGGCGAELRAELTELLSASLGIPTNRIKVM